jgi:acyl carrier protein
MNASSKLVTAHLGGGPRRILAAQQGNPAAGRRGIFIPGLRMINLGTMRTLEQTTQEILELATKQFKVPAGSLRAADDFYQKLAIDSLQALELLSRLENHFHIELPDYEVQGVSDFKTLAERIQARL